MVRLFFLTTISAILFSCAHVRVIDSSAKPGEKKSYDRSHYFFGMVMDTIKVDCNKGVYSITEKKTFGQGFARVGTLGIWCPSTVEIVCAK
jgi:hypothetical protein